MSRRENSSLFGQPGKRAKRLHLISASETATAKISRAWGAYCPDKKLDIAHLSMRKKTAIAAVIDSTQASPDVELSAHLLQALLDETWHAYLPPHTPDTLSPHIFKLISLACQSEDIEDEDNNFHSPLFALLDIALKQRDPQAATETLKALHIFLMTLYEAHLSLYGHDGFFIETTPALIHQFSNLTRTLSAHNPAIPLGSLAQALLRLNKRNERLALMSCLTNLLQAPRKIITLLNLLERIDENALLNSLVNIIHYVQVNYPLPNHPMDTLLETLACILTAPKLLPHDDLDLITDDTDSFESYITHYLDIFDLIMNNIALSPQGQKQTIAHALTLLKTKSALDVGLLKSCLEGAIELHAKENIAMQAHAQQGAAIDEGFEESEENIMEAYNRRLVCRTLSTESIQDGEEEDAAALPNQRGPHP